MSDLPPTQVLTIDQGTTNSKALLVDAATGRVLASGSAPVPISHPAPGWVEQDASAIWDSVRAAVVACTTSVPEQAAAPVAVAISNQRESVVVWDRRTGRPLGPVLGWQDARTADACAHLAAGGGDALVRARTGLPLDPMFSAPKMRWLLDRALADGSSPDDVCIGTVDSWLVWNLTQGAVFATDAGNASRTLLLDLHTQDWSTDLLELFGVPERVLPAVRPSDAGFGTTAGGWGLAEGVPIAAVLADSHAALFHHGCLQPGLGKATYGTGSSVMTPVQVDAGAPSGISLTLAWSTVAGGPVYAREGNIVASGSALDWMASALGGPEDMSGGAYLTSLAREAAGDTGGVTLVPAFSGLGAPYWDRTATGVLVGLTAGTTRAQLAAAALEAVAQQVTDVVEAMERDGRASLARLHADGGATASPVLMQHQADLLGRPVLVSDEPAASALGVGRMAAEAVGLAAPSGDRSSVVPSDDADAVTAVRPTLPVAAREAARARWRDAVSRSRGAGGQPTAGMEGQAPADRGPNARPTTVVAG